MVNALMNQAVNAYDSVARMNTPSVKLTPEPAEANPMAPSFSKMVGEALNSSMASMYSSEETSMKALAGKAELHDLVTAVANAELTLNTVVAIRDRVISAYQDIIRMPI